MIQKVLFTVFILTFASIGGVHAQGDRSAELNRALETAGVDDLLALSERQMAAGDFEQAAGVLTGLLLRDPDNVELHILLAGLYVRLDSFAQAQVYAEGALALAPLTENERLRAETLRDIAVARQERDDGLVFFGQAFTGIRYQTNASGGTSSSEILINDQLIDAGETGEARDDFDWVTSAFAVGRMPISEGVTFDVRSFLFARKQFQEAERDFVGVEATPGVAFDVVQERDYGLQIRPYIVGGLAFSRDELAAAIGGVGVQATQRFGRTVFLDQSIEHLRQNFLNLDGAPRADRRDGGATWFEFGAAVLPKQDLTLQLKYRAQLETTGREFLDNTRHRVWGVARMDYPTPFGISDAPSTASLTVTGLFSRFGAANPDFSATEIRQDRALQIELGNDFALSRTISIDASVRHDRRFSTLPQFDRRNSQGTLGVSVKF